MRLDAAPHDPGLRAAFESWLAQSERHRTAYQAVEPVWRMSSGLAPPSPSPAQRAVETPRRQAGRRLAYATAAALAACLALYFFPALQLRLKADHMTGVAELRDLTLEDGSRIQLDAGTAIAVHYGAARREVELLSGQAFFDVMPGRDRPFVVKAGEVAVTVTGTAFSVGTSEAGVAVAVQSGTVDVALDGGKRPAASLTRGERLRLGGSGPIARGEIDPGDVASWRDRRLVLYDARVRDVVEQLGRHHGGVILFGDRGFAEKRVTGVIDLRRPAEALHNLVELQQGSLTEITPYLAIISSR